MPSLERIGIKTCNNCKIKRCKINNGRGAIPFTNTCRKYTSATVPHAALRTSVQLLVTGSNRPIVEYTRNKMQPNMRILS